MDILDKNYYEILETPYDSSFELIKENYMKAKNAYSNDSLALYSLLSEDECRRILETIDEAYSILSDTHKRQLYNEARGISTTFTPRAVEVSASLKEEARDRPSVNKIAQRRAFNLDFEVNADMEKQIESCQDFTGDFLKQVREYKNVDILKMSEMTKVSKTYIRYIEEENFTGLPATVYVRGFVYQYAKSLKLNPEQVAASYLARVKAQRD